MSGAMCVEAAMMRSWTMKIREEWREDGRKQVQVEVREWTSEAVKHMETHDNNEAENRTEPKDKHTRCTAVL